MSDDMNISTMLSEQISRLLTKHVNRDAWIRAEEGQLDSDLWQEIENQGLTLALVGEELGGAGLGWADIEPSVRLCGQHAAPLPIVETMLGNWILSQAGLGSVAGPIAVSSNLFQINDNGCLSGQDDQVSWLNQSASVVLIARNSHGERFVCRVDSPFNGGKVATYDRQPCARLELDGVKPSAQAEERGELAKLGLIPYMAALRSIQIAGAMNHILGLCIEYANTRIQFGRPIGKFQAIQHMIADLSGQAAACQVAGLYAARQIDNGHAEYGAAIAKTQTSMSATRAATIAHQVFGAIGVTDEHSLHYYTRRLWQWRADAGSDYWWADYLGEKALDKPGADLWNSVVSRSVTA